MNLLGQDVEDLIFRLKHEIEFAPTLHLIKELHACAIGHVNFLVDEMWCDWGAYGDPEKYEKYAPGGRLNKLLCLEWYKGFLRNLQRDLTRTNFAKLRLNELAAERTLELCN
jgi:hypothetical protein